MRKSLANLRFGSGGGFTGVVNGHTLYPDGTLERWTKMPAGKETTERTIRIAPSQADSILGAFTLSGIFTKRLSAHGNMTAFISYTTKESSLTWSWPAGGSENDVMKTAHDILSQLNRFAASAEPDANH